MRGRRIQMPHAASTGGTGAAAWRGGAVFWVLAERKGTEGTKGTKTPEGQQGRKGTQSGKRVCGKARVVGAFGGRAVCWLLFAVSAGGCSSVPHSALDPAGPHAQHILWLGYLFLGVCVAVYVAVAGLLLWALIFRRASGMPTQTVVVDQPDARRERTLYFVVGGATALTTIILFVLLAGDIVTATALRGVEEADAVEITVVGNRWWWRVEYSAEVPSDMVVTANEIHVPVGRPVRLTLKSNDVIHSFWVPNLLGKKDMIPGYPTTAWMRADRPGVFLGQCAEYCGLQHAQMRLLVVASPPEEFEEWLAQQRAPAPEPVTEAQRLGREVFTSTSCVLCHTIRGTEAQGLVGPDLTHLASRARIAANSLENTPGHLAGWVVDPQKIKPGVAMPPTALSPEHLRALLTYLETLE